MQPVDIISTSDTYVRRFRVYGTRFTFKFNRPPPGADELEWVKRGFSDIVEKVKAEACESDYLGFTLRSLNLKEREPGYIAFRPASEVDLNVLWEIFGRIIQSNSDSVKTSDTFRVECTRVNVPTGTGRIRATFYNTFEEECKSRKGIITINNDDNMCLPRAIVVTKALAKKDPQFKAIRQDRAMRQTFRARKLVAKARVEIPLEGCGVPELQKFQDHLKKYEITVYNYNTKGRVTYYSGGNENAQYKINLIYHNRHFNVITSLTSAFVCVYYCEACHVPYNDVGVHRCTNICAACRTISPPCKLTNGGIVCPDCNIKYKNQTCFMAHQKTKCKTVKKCLECGKIVQLRQRKTPHVCGETFCSTCATYVAPEHLCYMQRDSRKPATKDYAFIFFDFETRQDENLNENSEAKVHKVNLCVSQIFCWKCMSGEGCDVCRTRTRVFTEEPTVSFVDYVLGLRKSFKQICVLAHNGQGFDFQFVLKHVLENTRHDPELIMRGTKIIMMKIDSLRFIDSLSFFPMALSALPKAFDLGSEMKKGYFPHLFNTLDNQNYIGPMPEKKYYSPDTMFEKNYGDFVKWHDELVRNNYVFDFKKEIVEYCISDVDILAQACLKFRDMFLKECNVDPFLEAVTIASACNLAFRRNFLKPETIGLVPKGGYRMSDRQSKIGLQWLSWEEEQRNVNMRHAGREREVKINNMKVDGFDGERVYEFQGCYYHGCTKCYPYKRDEPLTEDPSDSLHLRYERTQLKIEKLKRAGYQVIEMWECSFREMKKRENLKYLDTLPILDGLPLDPRDAFFGGRTGNAKTYHKCDEGEEIHYVDVCSLYPYVNKYKAYPLGHPKIHVGDVECRRKGMEVEGILKCKILPPRNLLHPVLPTRMHNKLMFVLCRTCGESLFQGTCEHDTEERVLLGTWTMDELRKAVSAGYVILSMYELWEYELATYESGGLFTDFINKFLKLKQEASGYPSWCLTDQDKDRYIRSYYDHEKIQLDKERIEKNGGLRSLAKLMLNSFWGKFGQRENQVKASIIREPSEFFKLLTSPGQQVNCIQEINEEVLLVNWQHTEEAYNSLSTVNVVLAAYTTSHARLTLYQHLEALGPRVLYYDTDSTIYIQKNNLYRVPTGDYLGEMTDELVEYGPGSHIVEFVSGGPKTYAYMLLSTNKNALIPVCKVKGLTLNLRTSEKMNFESLKRMVLKEREEVLEIECNRIRRTKDKELVTVKETKVFKVTGPKRRYEGMYDTLPYGYVQ